MVEFSSDPLTFSGGLRAGQPTTRHAIEPQFLSPPFLPGRPSAVRLFAVAAPAAATASSLDQATRSLPMFENRKDQMEILLKDNEEFRRLYNHHQQLEKRVLAAETGTAPMEDLALNGLKREKLRAKDQLARIMEQAQAA
jgi:uncharacterized protein